MAVSSEHGVRPISVVVADDHPLYREALREAIEANRGLQLLAVAGDGEQALETIMRLEPDVALLDMRMPGLHGKDVAYRLRQREVSTRVLFISEYHAGDLVLQAFTAGGVGYLAKTATIEEIYTAIELVATGEAVLPSDVGGDLASALSMPGTSAARLSAREQCVLELLADGDTATAIAERLHLAVPTVKTHIQNLYAKLGVGNRGAAVAEAMRRGLVE
jgi:two-component system nitrate/nitrite response regulator NarL